MSKKTRQQKIHADQQRQKMTFSYRYNASTVKVAPSTSISPTTSYIRLDLLKTIFLGGIFIIAEILLKVYSKQLGW